MGNEAYSASFGWQGPYGDAAASQAFGCQFRLSAMVRQQKKRQS
jgi:hypothetical protein